VPLSHVAPASRAAYVKERTFRLSGAGYREAAGQTREARRAKARLAAKPAADRARVLCAVGSGKTMDADAFAAFCSRRAAAFAAGRRLYGGLAERRARLRKYNLRVAEFHRLAQMLAWGATSVAGRASRASGEPPPRVPNAAKPRLTIVGWGSASTGVGGPLRRNGLGPNRAFERFVHSHYPSICFVPVDEYCTSQVCTCCWQRRGKHAGFRFGADRRASYKLQTCPGCAKLVVDRDVSAAIAIMAALLGQLFEDRAPPWPNEWRRRRRQRRRSPATDTGAAGGGACPAAAADAAAAAADAAGRPRRRPRPSEPQP
jgi:hypothetical protein